MKAVYQSEKNERKIIFPDNHCRQWLVRRMEQWTTCNEEVNENDMANYLQNQLSTGKVGLFYSNLKILSYSCYSDSALTKLPLVKYAGSSKHIRLLVDCGFDLQYELRTFTMQGNSSRGAGACAGAYPLW